MGSPGGAVNGRPTITRKATFVSLRRNSVYVSDTGDDRARLLPNGTSSGSAVSNEYTPLLPANRRNPVSKITRFSTFIRSKEFRNVMKCSIAYLLASLIVYTPLRKIYGISENKHMAATVAVYFHPARTAGSMIESIFFVFLSLAYSGSMAVTSMFVSRAFSHWDLKLVGYAIELFVFCAFGLGSIAFVKQRVNKPTFNTACSVAAIFLVTTLVKEGSVQAGIIQFDRVLLSFNLVSTGVAISALVCLLLYPSSAVTQVKNALNKSMGLNSELLGLLTDKFIDMKSVHSTQYSTLKNDANACFKNLHKAISDARYELHLQGKEEELRILKELINSSYRLLLHLNGLGSSSFTQRSLIRHDKNSNPPLTSSLDLFKQFSDNIGPLMKNYTNTLITTLDDMPFKKGPKPHYLATTIRATESYADAREKAIADLYKQTAVSREDLDFQAAASEEGAAASCGNFSYLLEEFGNELINFLRILDNYKEVSIRSPRSFEWLKFWKQTQPIIKAETTATLRELSKNLQVERISGKPTFSLRLWRSLHYFRRPDVQFGIKVGLGAAIFAIPAFTNKLRPLFGRWRGEWGLITFVIIMSKSVGGTSSSVKIRILGTFLGAFMGFLIWTAFPEHEIILPLIGFLVSIPCFYIILNWKQKNMFGRFILLTLNLTLLYTYSLSISDQDDGNEDDDETQLIVKDIAFHRFVSVCVGVIWALLITTLVLPNSARSKLKRGLSILWLQMGIVWKNDVLESIPRRENPDAITPGIKGETLMQLVMLELQEFLVNAPNELRLKGPFPIQEYKTLLASTQHILDAFQDISALVSKVIKPSSKEVEIIEYTRAERLELCNRIFLYFYLLSSAMRLGFPLPEKMPSTEHAIDRILVKLNECRLKNISKEEDYGDDEDFVLFYSYILVTINITEQLAGMALQIQKLFGVIEDDIFQV